MAVKKHLKKSFLRNKKGMALIESIPILFTIFILLNFSLGFFGAIHSGILNSIAAYNYTLETFRFRSDLMYFRPGVGPTDNYANSMSRVHGITQDGNEYVEQKNSWPVTVRNVAFTNNVQSNESSHAYAQQANGIWSVTAESTPSSGSPIETPKILPNLCSTAK